VIGNHQFTTKMIREVVKKEKKFEEKENELQLKGGPHKLAMIKHSKVVLISFVASLFYNPCISCPN
jgi:hypothetical protein